MAVTTLSIARGFDFDKVEKRIHLSIFLTNIWDKLSPDDKHELVEIIWDGFNDFVAPIKQTLFDEGLADGQIKARVDALTPDDGSKWDVDEVILRDTAEKILGTLTKTYRIKSVNA